MCLYLTSQDRILQDGILPKKIPENPCKTQIFHFSSRLILTVSFLCAMIGVLGGQNGRFFAQKYACPKRSRRVFYVALQSKQIADTTDQPYTAKVVIRLDTRVPSRMAKAL